MGHLGRPSRVVAEVGSGFREPGGKPHCGQELKLAGLQEVLETNCTWDGAGASSGVKLRRVPDASCSCWKLELEKATERLGTSHTLVGSCS